MYNCVSENLLLKKHSSEFGVNAIADKPLQIKMSTFLQSSVEFFCRRRGSLLSVLLFSVFLCVLRMTTNFDENVEIRV